MSYTVKKENQNFPHICIRKFNAVGSVAKSYMRKGFLIYEEMLKYLITIFEETVSHTV